MFIVEKALNSTWPLRVSSTMIYDSFVLGFALNVIQIIISKLYTAEKYYFNSC